MPIRLTPKARVTIFSGLVAHGAVGFERHLYGGECHSTQVTEQHEPHTGGFLGVNRNRHRSITLPPNQLWRDFVRRGNADLIGMSPCQGWGDCFCLAVHIRYDGLGRLRWR